MEKVRIMLELMKIKNREKKNVRKILDDKERIEMRIEKIVKEREKKK